MATTCVHCPFCSASGQWNGVSSVVHRRKCPGETCISFTCNDIASGERQDIPLRASNFITQKCILDDHSAVSSLLYGAIDTCQLIKQETGELYRRFKHRLDKGAYRNILEKRSIIDEIKCTKM